MYRKPDIINRIAELTYFKKSDIELMLLAFGEVMTESLLDSEGLQLMGYFKLNLKYHKPRFIKNKNLNVPGKLKIKFSPGKRFNEAMDRINEELHD